ncbi:Putative forkhead-associated (FHA) domain, SMAD/FHA domain superfamily, nibrin, second BRCT [Septoria linicola]|uniref:Forkhead-associated (FHA) domain, SMAD/FHA domain superfamily, nibrin, second BRCT n=1 Tax=Septoria linicola TaxID=215465 RepID=A0A9Q9EGG5_9PEZI|nr:Putative forkhead-associated (FHA) domain, SMAD/FHA domain superfamily, nibrin, second BRCT [Septoria linicola]
MWLISCTDAHWEGRRKWLRPGTKHLFGRSSTKPEGVDQAHYISHKSVSRKHFYITVGDVPSSATSSLHTKSSIAIEAAGKTGTWLDDERLEGDNLTQTLSGNKHTFKLGNAEAELTLEWHPVVLAFTTGVPKSAKAKGTALAAERKKLDRCDVKTATEYISNYTTHAVAKKRNTSAVLQALLQGKWVVSTLFVDALVAACKQDGKEPDGSPRASPLERDYNKHWPKEDEYICPTAGEPVSRPDSWLKPNHARAELFKDYTFLFFGSAQHSSLTAVVNAGGGKSLCFEFEDGKTSVTDVVEFVKELAGKKHARRFTLSEEPSPGGIVLIQMNAEALHGFQHELDIALDQRSVDQKELLDLILCVDATTLRRPPARNELDNTPDSGAFPGRAATSSIPAPPKIPATSSRMQIASSSIPSPPQATSDAVIMRSTMTESQLDANATAAPAERQGGSEEVEEEASTPPPRRRRRFITQKFPGFDDFEPSATVPAAPKSTEASLRPSEPSQAASAHGMDVDESIAGPAASQRQPHKRPAPVETEDAEEETAEQRYARIYPGQTALKRQKTEAAAAAAAKATSTPAVEQATPAVRETQAQEEQKDDKVKGKGKKPRQDTDLKAKITATREAQEEEHRLEEERLRQGLGEGEEIPMLGKKPEMLAEYELPLRNARPSFAVSDNPAWAGRPNYKKFKKQRVGASAPIRTDESAETPPAIIPLEETSARGNGMSEEYWLEHGDMHPRHLKQKQKQKQPTSQAKSQDRDSQVSRSGMQEAQASSSVRLGEGNAREEVDEDERAVFRRRLQNSREEDEAEAAANAIFDAPRGSGASTSQSTLGTETQKKAAGKRPATTQLGPAAAKKPRQTIATIPVSSSRSGSGLPASVGADDDEEDDPRAFRRKRR